MTMIQSQLLWWNFIKSTFLNEKKNQNFCFYRRRPAWCDRILYKTPQAAFKNMELVTEQTSYRSHPQFTISDHKPVTSEFTINVSRRVVRVLKFAIISSGFALKTIRFPFRFMKIQRTKWLSLHRCTYGKLVKRIPSNTRCHLALTKEAVIGLASTR